LFRAKYGVPGNVPVLGPYSGSLQDGGERLTLSHSLGGTIFSVAYADVAPWPATPDGFGFSLVPKVPGATPDDGAKWRASAAPGGSPGADDPEPAIPPVVINEILTHTDWPELDGIELVNPTPAEVNIGGWFLTDDPNAPKKYRIRDGTRIPAAGFVTFA